MPANENSIVAEMQKHIWVMESRALNEMLIRAAEVDVISITADVLAARVDEIKAADKIKLIVEDGTAVIKIVGPLMKKVPWWIKYLVIEATSYIDIAEQVQMAVQNDKVDDIYLYINSPGGYVEGVNEAAEAIFAARDKKPVRAYIDNMGASGAYWLAAQADTITAELNAIIGSIGVYMTILDSSKAAADLGFKINLIKSGPFKGTGTPGVPVTDKQLSEYQEIIDRTADNFIDAVAKGRGAEREKIAKLATGMTWIAGQAKQKGLIDKVVVTEAEAFSSDNNKKNILNDLGDLRMNEKEIKELTADILKTGNPDLYQKIFGAGKAEGEKAERDAFEKLAKVCGEDNETLVKCYREGKAELDAMQMINDKLKKTNAELAEKATQQSDETTANTEKITEKVTAAQQEFSDEQKEKKAAEGNDAEKTDAQLKEEFNASKELQEEFAGKVDNYIAFTKKNAEGRVKILGQK